MKYTKQVEEDCGIRLKNYCLITGEELKRISESDKEELITVYIKDDKYKFSSIGIYDFEISLFREYLKLQWGTDYSDPTVYLKKENDTVIGGDGEWLYFLYRPIALFNS